MRWSWATLFCVWGLASCSTGDALRSLPFRGASELQAASRPHRSVPLAAETERGTPWGTAWGWLNQWGSEPYALDDVARRLEPKTAVKCDPSLLRTYKGTSVPYAGAVLVDPAFVPRLARFETIVNQVSLEVYGRSPSRLLHMGAYACRKSRNRTTRLSEHALGNALDVVGVSFSGATKAQRASAPTFARGAFRVTVAQHWKAQRTEAGRLHRRFLQTLAERVVEAQVFRVVLGPSHPGHTDHLHLDMSPWHYTHL